MRVIDLAAITIALCYVQSSHAGEDITFANCMRHLGGGGFGDFDCYEDHAKSLEASNKKVFNAVKLASGVTDESKAELSAYMRTQDAAAKACDLAINLAYPSKKEREKRNHVELYDVMTARCHYSVRKQQSEFLRDLYSIMNDR